MVEKMSPENTVTASGSAEKAPEKKRLQYIDAVRGIAILWIIVYHLLAPCGFKTVIDHLLDPFLLVFFIFSGYFYRSGKSGILESIGKRVRSLLGPFFKFSLPFWAIGSVYLVAMKAETVMEAFLCLRNFLAGCIWNRVIQGWFDWEYYSLGKRYYFLADFWFLIAMFFASILFFLIVDKVLSSKSKCIASVVGLLIVTGLLLHFKVNLPYNIQLVPFWTALMLLGALAGSQKIFELRGVKKGAKLAIGLAMLVVGIAICMSHQPSLNMFRGSFGDYEVLSMVLCLSGSLPFVFGLAVLASYAEEAGVRLNEIAWCGSHSLIFFLSHMFLAWIFCTLTGFPNRYDATQAIPPEILGGSVLLVLACIAGGIVWNIAADKLKDMRKKQA